MINIMDFMVIKRPIYYRDKQPDLSGKQILVNTLITAYNYFHV